MLSPISVKKDNKCNAIIFITFTKPFRRDVVKMKGAISELRKLYGIKKVSICIGKPDVIISAQRSSGYDMAILKQEISSINGVVSPSIHLIVQLGTKYYENFGTMQ